MIQSRCHLSSKKSRECNRSPKREIGSDHREEGRRYGKSGSELGPEIRVRFQRVENDSVKSSLFIFSLRGKKIRVEEKRTCCGPVRLDCGCRGNTVRDGSEEQPVPRGGGPPRSCKVLACWRDLLHAEQFTWAFPLKPPPSCPLRLGSYKLPDSESEGEMDAGRRGRRRAEDV